MTLPARLVLQLTLSITRKRYRVEIGKVTVEVVAGRVERMVRIEDIE